MSDLAEQTAVDYSAMTPTELLELIGAAFKAKDMKQMGQLSKLYTKAEAAVEKTKKDKLVEVLIETTSAALGMLSSIVDTMVEKGELDGAEGIWFAYDFGSIREQGINPSCKLIKTTRKVGGGTSTGASSYIANPAKSADLLLKVGDHVMFAEDTNVTIDKQDQIMQTGVTFQQAYDHSTNGGWRNRVRMALLKEAGEIT